MAAGLANELVEAKQQNQMRQVMATWLKYDLIVSDEVGYVQLADIGAKFVLQVVSDRAERAVVMVTTKPPYSEWASVFANRRLCQTLLDRATDWGHTVDTGKQSYRCIGTLEGRLRSR